MSLKTRRHQKQREQDVALESQGGFSMSSVVNSVRSTISNNGKLLGVLGAGATAAGFLFGTVRGRSIGSSIGSSVSSGVSSSYGYVKDLTSRTLGYSGEFEVEESAPAVQPQRIRRVS